MSWSDCLLNPVTCVAENVGESAANSAWESFFRWSAQGLADLSATVFHKFSTSTVPRFDQQWWKDNLALMVTVSLPVLVAAFLLQCISAAIRREPGRLGHALLGALLGTAGVPLAIGLISSCGVVADEISEAVLGNHATAAGIKRMVDISAVLTASTLGGFVLLAIVLGLFAMYALYFVMLVREVALVAFVVFVPIAMASWTWAGTRHWLRRWIEIVGALMFSKVAMAVVFTLGLSALGASKQGASSTLGTFLAGILLVAMAAFTAVVTLSFIQWARDHGHAAVRMFQQGNAGVEAARDHVGNFQQWRADHFGGTDDGEPSPVVGDDEDPDGSGRTADTDRDIEYNSGSDEASPVRGDDDTAEVDTTAQANAHSAGSSNTDQSTTTPEPVISHEPGDGRDVPPLQESDPPNASSDSSPAAPDTAVTAIAVANSEVSIEGEPADSSTQATERDD